MAYSAAVTKAVIPVAGLGTRFLPATKATPKVMLPVVDKPAIQYVVEEAAAAGLCDVLLVTGDGQQSIADHFTRSLDLEAKLAARGNQRAVDAVRVPAELATVGYVRQDSPRGLGHAVLCARTHVGAEPFAVLLGDDLIDINDKLLDQMIAARQHFGGSIVALMEVPPAQVSAYGSAAFEPTDDPDVVRITDLVEKPDPSEAPSNWAVIGRYVCDPSIFGVLENTPPGHGGEIQITDALRTLAVDDGVHGGGGVHGVMFRGHRYDTGNKQDFLRTTVQFAASRPDLAGDFIPWLREFLRTLG